MNYKKLLNDMTYYFHISSLINKYRLDTRKHKSQIYYILDYLRKNGNRYHRIVDLLCYADSCRNIATKGEKKGYADNSRAFEIFRREKTPLCWLEYNFNGNKWVKYDYKLVKKNQMIPKSRFSKIIINRILENRNYRCEITGISANDCTLAVDHFVPLYNNGKSDDSNAVVVIKILNEHKNKSEPIIWFCKGILKNFLCICKRVGILERAKTTIIKFIQEYS